MPPAVIQILPNTGGAYQRAPMAKYAIAATMTASQFRSLRTSKLMAPSRTVPRPRVPSIDPSGEQVGRLEGHDAGYRQLWVGRGDGRRSEPWRDERARHTGKGR